VPCHAAQLFESNPAPSDTRPEFSAWDALKQSRGGTLLLTHVDELSPAHQVRLLGLLQWLDHHHTLRTADAAPRRIICLSGQPLRKLVSTAALRSDLASRMTSIRFALPPLRERREDIPLLAEIFTERFSATHGKPLRGLGPQTLPRLVQHTWPGNVRELESAIYSACLSCRGQWVRPIDLPALTATRALSVVAHSPMPDDDSNLDRAVLRHIQTVLARAEGNKLRAAKMLGISRSTLYRMLDSTSISNAS
jgi:two-component system response regulator AtoC